MRDYSVVPLSAPSSSQFYSNIISSNEVQVMPSLDISSFCWDSIAAAPAAGFDATRPHHHHHHHQQPFSVASYDLPFDTAAAAAWYGYSPFSACDTTSSIQTTNKLARAVEIDNGLYRKPGRKPLIEEVSSMATAGKRRKKNVQSITTTAEELKVPVVRRSQKLSDKITALQKLVSPYGKTDTASVLQEASIYIKLLQKQIQKYLSNMDASCCSAEDLGYEACARTIGGELLELRKRGICLVPKRFAEQCFVIMDPSSYQEDQV